MKISAGLALATSATLLLAACGSPASESTTDGPHIIAAFYPLEWASTQVLGDHGSVSVLTAPGAEAHDLELTPSQIASLADADLVVYLKDFQPAVDAAIAESGAKNVLDVSSVVNLMAAEEGHDHDEAEGEDHEGHDHGAYDPHFWQDPERMKSVVAALADKLGEADSSNAADFKTHASATEKELDQLDGEFQTGLAQCERDEFITTHAAFNYLAKRYGLTEIGVSGINPDDEPSPARIAEIHKEAQAHGVTTIFFETLTSNAVAQAIAGDLDLKTAVLDPLEGVTDKSPGTDYPSIMRANLEALRSANGCS